MLTYEATESEALRQQVTYADECCRMLQVTQQLALGKVMYNLEVQEKIASHRQVKMHKYKY